MNFAIASALAFALIGTAHDSLTYVENAQLPPPFRQVAIARPDGTVQTAFFAESGSAQRLPLAVFLSGSGAHSQFTVRNDRTYGSLLSVFARTALSEYHVAGLEKRGVRFGTDGKGTAAGASPQYNRFASLDERVAEVRRLLDCLLQTPLVDATRVLVVGHSEGADVAAALAAVDPRVTHVGFLSGGGPSQMFDLIVLTRKRLSSQGKSPQEIESAVRKLEGQYREILQNPTADDQFLWGHSFLRWSSFFRHSASEDLLKSNAALFVAHGSEDASGPIESFDALVVELIRAGRKHVEIRRYEGRDHSLRAPDTPANSPPMQDVFQDVVQWSLGKLP